MKLLGNKIFDCLISDNQYNAPYRTGNRGPWEMLNLTVLWKNSQTLRPAFTSIDLQTRARRMPVLLGRVTLVLR